MSRLTALALAAVATLTFAVTASAAARPLTKAEVIAQGSVICTAAERRVETAPQPRSQNPFAPNAPKGDRQRAIAFLGVYASALDSVRTGLAHLSTPAQGKQLLDRFIADLGPTVAMFRTARADALAGRYQTAMSHTQTAFSMFARASAATKRYGFPKGVCQAGS